MSKALADKLHAQLHKSWSAQRDGDSGKRQHSYDKDAWRELSDVVDEVCAKLRKDDQQRYVGESEGFGAALQLTEQAVHVQAENRLLDLLGDLVVACDQYDSAKPESVENYRKVLTEARQRISPHQGGIDGNADS